MVCIRKYSVITTGYRVAASYFGIMKLYPLQPIIFILAYTFVAISIAIQTPQTALTGILVLAAFMLLYFLTRKKN